MTKGDFLWYAVEITSELQRMMSVWDWDIYIALVRDADMKTDGRTEIDPNARTKQAYMRFNEEYWSFYDHDPDTDIIDAMYESITHELAHLWFVEGDEKWCIRNEEHVCSMITRVLRRKI